MLRVQEFSAPPPHAPQPLANFEFLSQPRTPSELRVSKIRRAEPDCEPKKQTQPGIRRGRTRRSAPTARGIPPRPKPLEFRASCSSRPNHAPFAAAARSPCRGEQSTERSGGRKGVRPACQCGTQRRSRCPQARQPCQRPCSRRDSPRRTEACPWSAERKNKGTRQREHQTASPLQIDPRKLGASAAASPRFDPATGRPPPLLSCFTSQRPIAPLHAELCTLAPQRAHQPCVQQRVDL